jgi:hypothetical protein
MEAGAEDKGIKQETLHASEIWWSLRLKRSDRLAVLSGHQSVLSSKVMQSLEEISRMSLLLCLEP